MWFTIRDVPHWERRGMQEIKGIARVTFHPGKLAEWKRLTEQAMEIVRTKDRGTLQYEVFFNAERPSPAKCSERRTRRCASSSPAADRPRCSRPGWPSSHATDGSLPE
jgi:hypothetical protein